MALNRVKGIISHMGEIQSGTSQSGYDWARQIIVLDVHSFNGTFSKIALTAQNQRVDDLQNYQIGDRVEIGYSVTAREYQGKWFNNVDLVNIQFFDEVVQAAPASRQVARANDAYEVCEHFCNAANCDYKLGTHGEACQRAMAAGQFTPPAPAAQPAPQRRVARPARTTPQVPPGANLEPQDDDLPC